MAIDIFAKGWSKVPGSSSKAVQGHALCPKYGFVCNEQIADLVRGGMGVVGSGAGTGAWRITSTRGFSQKAREHTQTSDFDRLGDLNTLFPDVNCTIVLGY